MAAFLAHPLRISVLVRLKVLTKGHEYFGDAHVKFQTCTTCIWIARSAHRPDTDIPLRRLVVSSRAYREVFAGLMAQLRLATEDTPSTAVHWLPCSVAHTGTAPVSSYFLMKPTGASQDNTPMTASLRPSPRAAEPVGVHVLIAADLLRCRQYRRWTESARSGFPRAAIARCCLQSNSLGMHPEAHTAVVCIQPRSQDLVG